MTRLFIMTFLGERRWTDDVHPHESPPVMTVPMIILAFGSVFAGGLLVGGGALQNWLIPSAGEPEEVGAAHDQPDRADAAHPARRRRRRARRLVRLRPPAGAERSGR